MKLKNLHDTRSHLRYIEKSGSLENITRKSI